jgi:hypothetical protein
MDGNREPEVVPAGLGGAGSGATVTDVARLLDTVRPCRLDDGGGVLIGQLRELEVLKPAAAALQARIAVAFDVAERRADTLRSDGDHRSRGQVMADALVERVSGTPGRIAGIEIQLVRTDRTLLQGDPEPARLPGYGIVPAGWARNMIKDTGTGSGSGDGTAALKTWLRRLYTAPAAATSSRWTPAPGSSPQDSATSSRPATTPAAPPTATSQAAAHHRRPGPHRPQLSLHRTTTARHRDHRNGDHAQLGRSSRHALSDRRTPPEGTPAPAKARKRPRLVRQPAA